MQINPTPAHYVPRPTPSSSLSGADMTERVERTLLGSQKRFMLTPSDAPGRPKHSAFEKHAIA